MRRLRAKLLVLLSCLPLGAAAQRVPADSVRADSLARRADSARTTLPSVTVTATRQRESIYTVPLAVSVVRKAELEKTRGYSMADALQGVPGVLAQTRYGSSDVRLVIRGFGARGAGDRSNAGTSRGVRVLVDGIPETEPDGRTSFDLVDFAAAERVEIIRSNASALWGNAAGGVVDITTAVDVQQPFVSAGQMAGSFGLLRTTLQAGKRFGDASLSATFTNTSHEGWRAHSDARRALLTTALIAPLGARTTTQVLVTAANDLFHIPGPLTREQFDADPRQANATYAARDERRHNKLGRIGLTLEHQLDSANSISGMFFLNPKVLQRSERNTFRDFNRLHLGGNLVYRNRSRLGTRMRGTTIVGADEAFQGGTILFYSLSPNGTRGGELRDNKGENATNRGLFLQQELLFAERFAVEAGARYDAITYNYRNFITPGVDAAKSFERVTPKLGMSYRVSPAHSFYMNVGGGIEAPAGNETDPAGTFGQDTVTAINPLLDAIRSTTYEVGTKQVSLFGSASLAYDAALYRTEVRNEIIPYRGGRFYFSAGRVRREGAELGASVGTAAGFQLRGSVTYARNRYTEYVVDSVHYGKPGAFASYAGNRVAGLPDVFYTAMASQDIAPLALNLQVAVRGTGRYFADDPNVVEVPAQNTVGVTASLAHPVAVGGFLLRGFVEMQNVFDKRYIGSAFTNPDFVGGVPVAFEPGSPRGVIVSLSVSRGK
ncbi:MAG TPA: TonB-dependent receptor [Gemmatimonadaceae bacterium]|nr:TonB-dependent receptor [Gemmatimonadaceae bacterium]